MASGERRVCSILYIDDRPERAVALALERSGARVVTARSVAEAVDRASPPARWHGFFVDHRLGDGWGLDLIPRLIEWHPRAPIVLATGDNGPEVTNRCYQLGVGYLQKGHRGSLGCIDTFARQVCAYWVDPCYPSVRVLADEIWATPRERQLLHLALRERLSSTAIAERMGISPSTVRVMVRGILRRVTPNSLARLAERITGDEQEGYGT